MTSTSTFTDIQVRAAGGVVLRTGGAGIEVLVVHRPGYDDWTLPKGKLNRDEGWKAAAVREVHEETGVTGEVGVELTPTYYIDRKGRTKQVRWWTMRVVGEEARPPDDEVDEVVWMPVAEADIRLTRASDRDLVQECLERHPPA